MVVTGRRWGKTTLAVNHLTLAALLYKGNYWYIAPTYKQAKMIAWKMFLQYIPDELIAKTNETDLSIFLKTGSEICLKGADNPDSLRGIGLHMAILDEYSSMKPFVWQEIVRPMLTDTLGRALFIGTPKGKNHFWELWIKGQRHEESFRSWAFKTIDNPYIDPKEIEEAKLQMNERYFRQEYEASFEDYVGLIWPEFDKKSIIEPCYLPEMFDRRASIDPAISGTTASLKAAIDEDGDLIIYSEYYEQNKRVSEVSKNIKDENVVKWIIDPASKSNNIEKDGKLSSLYSEYILNGITAELGENDVDSGINRVAEHFKQGRIKIFSTCKNLIRELERYHWSEERETLLGIIKPKPYKAEDHLCDCLRYLVMSNPAKSKFPVKQPNPNSAWGRLEAARQQRGEPTYARPN